MGKNGVLNAFQRPKPGVAPYIKGFNARSIFLQDGLKFAYRSNETLEVDLLISNYGSGPLPKVFYLHKDPCSEFLK